MKVEEKASKGGAPGHLVGEKGGVYLLLGHLQQAGGAKGGADAEEGERRILALPVLAVERFNFSSDVETLKDLERYEANLKKLSDLPKTLMCCLKGI